MRPFLHSAGPRCVLLLRVFSITFADWLPQSAARGRQQAVRLGLVAAMLFLSPTCVLAFGQDPKNEAQVPQGYEEAKTAKQDSKKKNTVPEGYEDAKQAGEAPAAKVNARRRAALVAIKQGVDLNVLNLEKQYLPQIHPLLKAELSFVQRVCQPTHDQHREIALAKDKCLKIAVRQYAIAQNNLRQGGFRRKAGPSPERLIQQEMAKIVKEKLSAEQANRYNDELDKRRASRKRAVVLNLVSRLDHCLVLTPEQRDKLVDSLSANWADAEDQTLQMFMNGSSRLYGVPNEYVTPFLNTSQQAILRSVQNQGIVLWGFQPVGIVVNDFEEDEEEAAPANSPYE